MANTEISLKWNGYQSNILFNVKELLQDEGLSDVTLVSEGHSFKAHKVILSANSSVFRTIFQQNPHKDPIIVLHDISTEALRTILTFMYNGEVNVTEEFLPLLLKTAETLKICGLSTSTEVTRDDDLQKNTSSPVPKKRKKSEQDDGNGSCKKCITQDSNDAVQDNVLIKIEPVDSPVNDCPEDKTNDTEVAIIDALVDERAVGNKTVSLQQINALLDFMEKNKDLALGHINRSKEGRSLSANLWRECSKILNKMSAGCTQKSSDQWRTFFNEYKCKTLRKARTIKRELEEIGEGRKISLDSHQQRLCTLLAGSAVYAKDADLGDLRDISSSSGSKKKTVTSHTPPSITKKSQSKRRKKADHDNNNKCKKCTPTGDSDSGSKRSTDNVKQSNIILKIEPIKSPLTDYSGENTNDTDIALLEDTTDKKHSISECPNKKNYTSDRIDKSEVSSTQPCLNEKLNRGDASDEIIEIDKEVETVLQSGTRIESLSIKTENLNLVSSDTQCKDPSFPCPFCPRVYNSWGYRRRHVKSRHVTNRLSCKWCVSVLPSTGAWYTHATRAHGVPHEEARNSLVVMVEAHAVLTLNEPGVTQLLV